MISLRHFIKAIHDAIVTAHDSVLKNHEQIVAQFFEERSVVGEDEAGEGSDEDRAGVTSLVPKTVAVAFPLTDKDGNVTSIPVHVPLLTLVPLSNARIEKATISVEFDLEAHQNEEGENVLELTFAKQGPDDSKSSKMELTIGPMEAPDGVKILVEGYEGVLKRQMP